MSKETTTRCKTECKIPSITFINVYLTLAGVPCRVIREICGIRNPEVWNSKSSSRNPESNFHRQGIRIQYLDPESMAWNPQSMITFHGTTPWIYSDTVWIACWLLSVEQYKVWINKDVFGLILEWNSSIVCYWSGERCYDEKSSINIFCRTCLRHR